jgi:hypothetical protein
MNKIMEVIRSMKALPCHTILIAHEQYDKDELSGEIRMTPNVFGKLAAVIASEFNLVLYAKTQPDGKGGLRYVWQTQPAGFVKSAGSTYVTGLPPIVDQDFSLVINPKRS